VLLLGAGGEVFVGEDEAEEVDVVLERVGLALDLVVVANLVEVVLAEDFELKIVVKGFKSPDIVKVPSPVWQSQFARGSLSQQNPLFPQLTTPASERELNKPAVALSGNRHDQYCVSIFEHMKKLTVGTI
jgi:hypothetical protein